MILYLPVVAARSVDGGDSWGDGAKAAVPTKWHSSA